MEIILLENILNLGNIGDKVSVKNGFGRNYLIPNGLGILATENAVKILKENLRQQDKKESAEIASATKISELLPTLEVIIKAKVAEGGTKLFGSIKVSQFVDALAALGHKIDSKFVKISSIKELGEFEAEVRLHRMVSTTVPFKVIAE